VFLKALLIAIAVVAPMVWLLVVRFVPRNWESRRADALVLRLWLYAPIWVSLLVVVSAMTPAIVTGLVFGPEYCSMNAHHHHLCVWHAPSHSHSSTALLIPLLVALPSLVLVSATGRRIWRERRLVRTLLQTSRPHESDASIRVLDQLEPIALTVGWTEPKILVSSGLIQGLGPESFNAILAHERAHARRRDALLAALDRFAASILPEKTSRPLLKRLHLLRELACDSEAARDAHPVHVAKALTEVARMRGLELQTLGTIGPRVRSLLDGPEEGHSHSVPVALALPCFAILGAWPVHNAIELLLSILLH